MVILLDFKHYWHVLKQQSKLHSLMLGRYVEVKCSFAFINVLPNQLKGTRTVNMSSFLAF